MSGRIGGRRGAALSVALLIAASALSGCGGGGEPTTFVACVDSTHSTVEVRPHYRPELLTIAEKAAEAQGNLYVDACGSNATGTVDWTVTKEFQTEQDLSGVVLRQWATSQAKDLEGDLNDVLTKTSPDPGTPLGEILGVIARKCEADPGPCEAYVLTDASWWDKRLKVYNGVTPKEKQDYVAAYGPLVKGLDGASVSFVGVGLGTDLGEEGLNEAREVAEALVEAGGGKVVYWDVSLSADEDDSSA